VKNGGQPALAFASKRGPHIPAEREMVSGKREEKRKEKKKEETNHKKKEAAVYPRT
jgi:hypothetical protein